MSRTRLEIGYVPLVDSAPLVIARELGFAAREGIELDLSRQPSWSALRDLLAHGLLDAAQILSPLPIALSLGLGGLQVGIDALMVLSVNGNVFGVSHKVAGAMRAGGWSGRFDTPAETGRAFLDNIDAPRIAVPFPHSMHSELLRFWFGKLGKSVVQTVTVPPPLMAQAVGAGQVDLFCVGEPWGSLVVEQDVGELILPGAAIWAHAPEKVLGARRDWVATHPEAARGLVRAVWRAGEWLALRENRALASEVLARSDFLDLPEHVIDRALRGELCPHFNAAPVRVPEFLNFHGGSATFPFPEQATWIAERLAIRHRLDRADAVERARAVFRADLYQTWLSDLIPARIGSFQPPDSAMSPAGT